LTKTYTIDVFADGVLDAYRDGHAVVAVDVIRATTTAVTAAVRGIRVFPVASLEGALPLAARLDRPLLVGELGGNMPYGFDLNNSPVAMDTLPLDRPVILLSTSGTRLIVEARGADAVYAGCLRNVSAQARALVAHDRVALVGAGTRGEFRPEDQLGCAWIAARLEGEGFEPAGDSTREVVARWRDADVASIEESASAEYLRTSGQLHDLAFVLAHVDDLDAAFRLEGEELVRA
jgi:2-phosphosulfolactate phosphatase